MIRRSSRAAFTDTRGLPRDQRSSSQDFSIEIVNDLPEGPLPVGREGEPNR